MYEIRISQQTFEEMAPWEQLEVLELQVGILESYIKDHRKKVADGEFSKHKIAEYETQIANYRAQMAELEAHLTNKASTARQP